MSLHDRETFTISRNVNRCGKDKLNSKSLIYLVNDDKFFPPVFNVCFSIFSCLFSSSSAACALRFAISCMGNTKNSEKRLRVGT